MYNMINFHVLLNNTFSNGNGSNNINFAIINDHIPQVLLPLLLSLIIWFLLKDITYKSSNKGSAILPPLPPGPKPLPLLGNLLSLNPELHTYLADLSKSYGPILTLWLGKKVAIVITSPALAREVLKDQDAVFANRDVPVAGLETSYGASDIVSTNYGPEWRMLRKVCVREMLCTATLESVYALRRSEVRQTIRFIYVQSQAGKPVNVGEQMFLTILNVITNMMWGGKFTGGERASLASEFREVVRGITQCLGAPNISDFYPGLARFDLQGILKKTRVYAGKLDDIFESLIEQRVKKRDIDDESKDFLQFLLKLMKKDQEGDDHVNGGGAPPLTRTHVKALLSDMIVGGTENTSNTVEFALAEMMKKPEVLRKVQRELETIVGRERSVEESDIQKLPYLYAVMKEVLRLHPSLPLLVPHSPSETCVVGGYRVPKGASVFVNVWAIHRDPTLWENPAEFRPERFLDLEDTKMLDYSGNDFKYFPFGSGRRSCVGIGMSERMFMYSMASLVHSFDWKMADQGESLEVEEQFGIVLKKRNPLVAIPTPRLSDASLYDP